MTLILAILLFGAGAQSRPAVRSLAILSLGQFGQSTNQNQPQNRHPGGFGGFNANSSQNHWSLGNNNSNSNNSGGLGNLGSHSFSFNSNGSDNGCGNDYTDSGGGQGSNGANGGNGNGNCHHHHHKCSDDHPSPENPTWILGLLGFAGLYFTFTRKKLN